MPRVGACPRMTGRHRDGRCPEATGRMRDATCHNVACFDGICCYGAAGARAPNTYTVTGSMPKWLTAARPWFMKMSMRGP